MKRKLCIVPATIETRRGVLDLSSSSNDLQLAVVENSLMPLLHEESVVRIYDVGRLRADEDDDDENDDNDDMRGEDDDDIPSEDDDDEEEEEDEEEDGGGEGEGAAIDRCNIIFISSYV